MDNNFHFDPIEHRYWLGDDEMPSLSRILEPLNDFSGINPEVLAAKAQAGTDIHLTVKMWLDGTLEESSLSEGNKIALELFIAWYKSYILTARLMEYEKPTYHEKLKYGTTPDIVFEESVVEIKTRPYNKYRDPVQLIAQSKCFSEFPPKSLWVLSLDIVKNKYTFQRAEHKQAWSVFRKLYDKYQRDREFENFLKTWKGQ